MWLPTGRGGRGAFAGIVVHESCQSAGWLALPLLSKNRCMVNWLSTSLSDGFEGELSEDGETSCLCVQVEKG